MSQQIPTINRQVEHLSTRHLRLDSRSRGALAPGHHLNYWQLHSRHKAPSARASATVSCHQVDLSGTIVVIVCSYVPDQTNTASQLNEQTKQATQVIIFLHGNYQIWVISKKSQKDSVAWAELADQCDFALICW